MRHLLVAILCGTILCVTIAAAQQAPPNATGAVTFSSTTQLVVETVTVKDKAGKPINGLTASDFTITEDGVPQAIKFFEWQQLAEAAATSATPTAASRWPPAARPLPFKKLPQAQVAPESPGTTRYRDHRLLALYFDMSAMPPADQLRAVDAAEKFIRNQATPSDLMAVMMFSSGSVRVLSDFTDDRDRLLRILETLAVGEDQDFTQSDNDDSSADTGAAFGQDDSEFNIFNTDRQLAALQTAASMLGHLSEKKALLYFASGLRLNGVDNQAAAARHRERRDSRGRFLLAD